MAKKDCPFCEGRKKYFIANTNIELDCNFCDNRGEIPRPKNFDATKIEPGLIEKITSFFKT